MPRGQYDRSAARERRVGTDVDTSEPESPLARVRLVRPHGYLDENNRHRFWKAGDILSDPAEIDHLRQRGVELENVE